MTPTVDGRPAEPAAPERPAPVDGLAPGSAAPGPTPSRPAPEGAASTDNPAPGTWAGHWAQLVAAGLLGTDRRPPPPPLPGALAVLMHDPAGDEAGGGEAGGDGSRPVDDAARLLDQVAAVAVGRRAGLRPAPAPAPLVACPPDPAPPCPVAAGRRLAELLEAWPMLVDEWLAALVAAGYRLPPEHTVTLLARYRADPRRRARVVEAAGPVADWVAELFPELLAARRPARAAPARVVVDAEAAPPLSPDLAPLAEAVPGELVAGLVDGVRQGRWSHRHRALLVRLLGVVDPAVLPFVAAGLAAAAPDAGPRGAVELLGDLAVLARTRAEMLAELAPPEEAG